MNLTLEKGLNILETLAGRAEPMTVGEVAEMTDTNPSTAFRMLETLKHRGYAEQEHMRGDYRAGLKVLELSAEILHRMELRRKAGPYLHSLSETTMCDSYLAAANSGRALMIMTCFPRGKMQSGLGSIGHVNSFYCTAMGKLIAAFSPEQTTADLVSEKLTPVTPSTITDRDVLSREYQKIRETEISHSRYENAPDTYGIAVPVRNFEGEVIATLGLAVPRKKEEKYGIEKYEEILRETGEQISFALGYAAERLV